MTMPANESPGQPPFRSPLAGHLDGSAQTLTKQAQEARALRDQYARYIAVLSIDIAAADARLALTQAFDREGK